MPLVREDWSMRRLSALFKRELALFRVAQPEAQFEIDAVVAELTRKPTGALGASITRGSACGASTISRIASSRSLS